VTVMVIKDRKTGKCLYIQEYSSVSYRVTNTGFGYPTEQKIVQNHSIGSTIEEWMKERSDE